MNLKVLLVRRLIRFLLRQVSFDISVISPEGGFEERLEDWKNFSALTHVRGDMKRWITQLHNQSLKYTDARTLALLTGQMLVLARILNYKVVKKQPTNKPNYPAYESKTDSEDISHKGFKLRRADSDEIEDVEIEDKK